MIYLSSNNQHLAMNIYLLSELDKCEIPDSLMND